MSMPRPDPFASLERAPWYEAALDVAVPTVAALLTVLAFVLAIR